VFDGLERCSSTGAQGNLGIQYNAHVIADRRVLRSRLPQRLQIHTTHLLHHNFPSTTSPTWVCHILYL